MCFISALITFCLRPSSHGWVFVRHHQWYLSVYLKVTSNSGFLKCLPWHGKWDSHSAAHLAIPAFVTLLLQSPNVAPAAAQVSHSPALGEFVSLQEWDFFCSSRELIICYAQALTSVLLWLCAPFWHCIIQSIWHWTGENESSRKLIPQTINFISKSALQNIAWKGGRGLFFILFYSPNYTVTS